MIVAADRPAADPRNCSNAGPKSVLDRPCNYNSGSTSASCGDLRAHAVRQRSPWRLTFRSVK